MAQKINNITVNSKGTFMKGGKSSSILGGEYNIISGSVELTSSINNEVTRSFSVIDGPSHSTIVGGVYNFISGSFTGSAIVGGTQNTASAGCTFIGSGCGNKAYGQNSSIVSGRQNCTYGNESIVGGGFQNIACTNGSGILSGCNNCVCTGVQSVIAGGGCATICGQDNFIGGGRFQSISDAENSTITGGCNNKICSVGSDLSGILGGECNIVQHCKAFIIGANITSTGECTTFVNNFHSTGSNGSSNVVILANLPTSDPNNIGQVWNDSGTLKISAG